MALSDPHPTPALHNGEIKSAGETITHPMWYHRSLDQTRYGRHCKRPVSADRFTPGETQRMTRRGTGRIVLGILLTAILGGVGASAAEPAKGAAPSDKIANSDSLRDLRGNRRSLHDFKDHSAVVLVFLGADCPVSNLYV